VADFLFEKKVKEKKKKKTPWNFDKFSKLPITG